MIIGISQVSRVQELAFTNKPKYLTLRGVLLNPLVIFLGLVSHTASIRDGMIRLLSS